MLGDHNLITMAQRHGRLADFAALIGYGNRKSRVNWLLGAQQIPYIYGGILQGYDTAGNYVQQLQRFKQTNREFSGILAYPFNRSRRIEMSAGVQQITYDYEIRTTGINGAGQVISADKFKYPTWSGTI